MKTTVSSSNVKDNCHHSTSAASVKVSKSMYEIVTIVRYFPKHSEKLPINSEKIGPKTKLTNSLLIIIIPSIIKSIV